MRSMPFLMKEGYFTILSMVKSVRLRKANLWKPDGCKDMNFYLETVLWNKQLLSSAEEVDNGHIVFCGFGHIYGRNP